MSMKDSLNKKLKDIVNQIATIESKSDKGEQLTEADLTAYKSLNAEGASVRQLLDEAEVAEALKAFANQPDGNSAARKSMTQEFTTPEDREQEQRAQEHAAKNPYMGAWESYLRHGMKGLGPNDRKLIENGAIKAADMKVLTEGVAQGGGYLVPEQYMAEVLKKEPGLMGLNDIVRAQPTSRDVILWPVLRYSTSNVYTAPHRLTWTGEVPSAATIHRVTDETFGEFRIPINVAMASQPISNTLIEDSAVDVMQLTASIFRENIMQDLEAVIANGTGAGQPEGLFTNGRARADCVTGGVASGFTTTAMLRLYWGLPAQYRKNAKFVMNSATGLFLAQMTDNNGRFLWQQNDAFGGGLGSTQQDGVVVAQPKLLGMPLVISEQSPANTTNNYPVAFGDFRGYIRADRVGMTIRVLDELYAETDQKLYLTRLRVGGALAEDYRIKLLRCQV